MQTRRGCQPLTDGAKAPWFEDHRGCDPPMGLPVKGSCLPLHDEEGHRGVYDKSELEPEDFLRPDVPDGGDHCKSSPVRKTANEATTRRVVGPTST